MERFDAAFDAAVIGVGAAGMMCAAQAGQRGLRVVLIDHATNIGEKIRISGGGRCNFTNVNTGPDHFISHNRHFCRSALARYSAADFIALMRRHRIAFHEKHRGQLFCDDSAEQIIAMLEAECASGRVAWRTGCSVTAVRREGAGFALETERAGTLRAAQLVIATGGLSIPKIGASDFGYRIARQFGLKIIEPRPALVPLTFPTQAAEATGITIPATPSTTLPAKTNESSQAGAPWQAFAQLAGLASEVEIGATGPYGRGHFREDLLFTHKGLSGPAVLQISTFWQSGERLLIDLAPGIDITDALLAAKRDTGRGPDKTGNLGHVATVLTRWLPRRLAQALCESVPGANGVLLADCPDRVLRALGAGINQFSVLPSGTEGFRKAEVTVGGVDTRELSSQTMAANKVPGLYFIGEVVDVTGWLGGYNFQWAWSSAVACARALEAAYHMPAAPAAVAALPQPVMDAGK